jgi:LuxR family maltose regulon positive regulatory protein
MTSSVPYIRVERPDSQLDMTNEVFDLEGSVRTLLDAVGGLPENEIDTQSRLTFEVCIDGRRYILSIVESGVEDGGQPCRLSPREQEIVRLIAKGFPTKTIASELGLRPCTVSTYTKRIYLKLKVNSRAEMVAKVLHEPSLFRYHLRPAERAS